MDDKKDCLGQMKYCGLLSGSVSYHGHSVDILRNHLEESLRHGSSDLYFLMRELDHFRLCGGESIRTNMMNRVVAMASHCMGIAEPQLPIYVEKLVWEWEKYRVSEVDRGDRTLLAIYRLLERSRRREGFGIQDIYTIYVIGPQYDSIRDHAMYRALLEANPEETPEETPEANPEETPEETPGETPGETPEETPGETPEETPEANPEANPEATPEGTWMGVQERDPPELQCVMERFIYWLSKGSLRALEEVGKILGMRKKKIRAGTRFRGWRPITQPHHETVSPLGGRMRPEYAIWEYLFQYNAASTSSGPQMACLEALFGFFNTRSESELYLTHAVLYFLEEVDWSRTIEIPQVTEAEMEASWQQHRTMNWKPHVYPVMTEEPLLRQIRILGGKDRTGGKSKGRRKKKQEAPMMDYVGELEEEPIPT